MTQHVRTVTRHKEFGGFSRVTLPAMPDEPGARPWEPVPKPPSGSALPRATQRAQAAVLAALTREGPMSTLAIVGHIGRHETTVRDALTDLLRRGLVGRTERRKGKAGGYIWHIVE